MYFLVRSKMKSRITFFLLAFLISSFVFVSHVNLDIVQGATSVTGIINSDTVWTKINSPYNFTGNVLVNEGVTLTVDPGVTIFFNGYFINVAGTLLAKGNETEKIIILGSGMDYSGEWMGRIHFLSTSNNSIIEYAEITSTVDDSINIQGGSPKISNNLLTNVSIRIGSCSPLITENRISELTHAGIFVAGTTTRESVVITENVISNNGVGVYLSYDASSPIISDNIISNNVFGIISDCMWSNATIINNLIIENHGYLESGYPSPMIADGAGILLLSGYNYGMDISGNTISKNKYGIDIHGNPFSTINQNNIFDNIDYNIFNNEPEDIAAVNNWWGTNSTQVIDQSIYDLLDDFNIGKVNYVPFLNELNPDAPEIPIYNISASAGSGGSIIPIGSISVNYAATQTFNIAANAGYNIVDVLVNDNSVGAVSSYTFNNVQAANTISATFAPNPTPTPTATPTPTPTPTATPTPTPTPTATPTIEPSPTIPEFPTTIALVSVIVIGTGMLIYFRKHKK